MQKYWKISGCDEMIVKAPCMLEALKKLVDPDADFVYSRHWYTNSNKASWAEFETGWGLKGKLLEVTDVDEADIPDKEMNRIFLLNRYAWILRGLYVSSAEDKIEKKRSELTRLLKISKKYGIKHDFVELAQAERSTFEQFIKVNYDFILSEESSPESERLWNELDEVASAFESARENLRKYICQNT